MVTDTFKESQKFTQWWLWILLLGIGALLFYVQNRLGAVILIAISLLFLFMRLDTEISHKRIGFNFFPFVKKKFKWSEISSAKVVDYGFVGGWGIRLYTSYGTVYNIKGSKGLAIELKNGKKFCLGTQRPAEIQNILSKIPFKNEI